MQLTRTNVYRALYATVILSIIIRCLLAYFVEFGNDEVYYVNYALFPDWSHFDHPPFVGWLIQLTTLNLQFENELLIRLGPILIGGVNTLLIFQIGRVLKNELVGLYASMIYTASLYSFVIVGVFIMPDAPQSLFWLISILMIVNIFRDENISSRARWLMLILGITIGFGMLSKYTAIFLWIGVGLYVIIFDRRWLKEPMLYIAIALTLIVFAPVIIWNVKNNFISINYHSGRVVVESTGFNYKTFLTEIVGSIFYNGIVNVIMVVVAPYTYIFKIRFMELRKFWLLIFLALPIMILFLTFSMFRQTLPHWSAPGYFALILIAAIYLASKYKARVPAIIIISLSTTFLIVLMAVFQIKTGYFNLSKNDSLGNLGSSDFSLDMYGYKQLGEKFTELRDRDIKAGLMVDDPVIIGYKWFPTSHIDYYVARPNHIKVMTLSSLFESHKYAWITEDRGGLRVGMDAYFINSSRYKNYTIYSFGDHFESVVPVDTISIYRGNKHAMDYVVWHLKGLKNVPPSEINR